MRLKEYIVFVILSGLLAFVACKEKAAVAGSKPFVVTAKKDSTKKKIRKKKVAVDSVVEPDYANSNYLRYNDHVYDKNIHTVLLHAKNWNLSLPVIKLNSGQQLLLSFDDFSGVLKTYDYTVIHCDANWKPSDLTPYDYLDGFTEDYISNYNYSFNTMQKYINYQLLFPNDNIKITKSGNYLLKVYLSGNPDSVVITKRFMVYQNKVTINAQVRQPIGFDDMNYKQKVDFTILHDNFPIPNPYTDLKVVITQNGRWDNALTTLKPLFVKDNELDYNYTNGDNLFPGGNEYRYFDMTNIRYASDRIVKVSYDSSMNQVYLQKDEPRSFKQYFTQSDIDGQFLIKTQNGSNYATQGDYAMVHFFLSYDAPVVDGNIYVFGQLSDWQCTDQNKMHYDYSRKGYVADIYLKEGYYDYEYAYLKDGKSAADLSYIEGTHYDTENKYTIYVYYRSVGTFYDQLIGLQNVSSTQ